MIAKIKAKSLLLVFSVILVLDILSKYLTHSFLPYIQKGMIPYPYGGIGVFENLGGISFSLIHQTNTGAAWGLFPNFQSLLLYIRLSIITLLFIYIFFINKNIRTQIPFAFIIAGAVGNVIDTVFYGHVIDMMFFQLWGYDFPVFNVADSFIFLGVAWLCLFNLKKSKKTQKPSFNDSDPFNS